MTYKAPVRNRGGIQFDRWRNGFDQKYEAVHDALSAAYYDHWRQGEAHALQIGDFIFNVVNGTPRIRRISTNNLRTFPNVTAKQFFDRLHARLHRMAVVGFHALILSLPEGERPPKYDIQAMQTKVDADQAVIDAETTAGLELEVPELPTE